MAIEKISPSLFQQLYNVFYRNMCIFFNLRLQSASHVAFGGKAAH